MSAALQTGKYYLNDAQTIYISTNGTDMLLNDTAVSSEKKLSNLLTGTLTNGQIGVSDGVHDIANYPTLTFDSVKNSLSINNTNPTIANLSVKQAITMWIAGGYNTGIWSSNDGFVWINRGAGVMDSISYVSYNGTIWIAVGASANFRIAYSYDGINWTGVPGSKDLFSSTCRNAVWNGTMWVAIGAGTNTTAYSYDGINWNAGTNIFTGTTTGGQGVAWNGTVWLAVGEGNVNLATSTDGINWTAVPTYSTSLYSSNIFNGCHTVAYGGGKWMIGGYAAHSAMYYTTDPTALTGWTAITGTGFNSMGAGKSIAYNGSYWIALSGNIASGGNSIIKSTDGITWTGVSNVFTISYGASWNGKMWLAAGTNGSNGLLMYSYDGDTWSQITTTFPGTLTGVMSRNAPALVPPIIAPYPPIQEWISSVGDIVATVNAAGDFRILNDFWITGTIKIGSPSITSSTFVYSLPTTAGTSGQVLTSAGTGNQLTWSAGGGGSITFPIVSNNLATSIQLSNTTTPANTTNGLLNINNLRTGNFYGIVLNNSGGGEGMIISNTGGGTAIDINSNSGVGIATSLGSGSTTSSSALNITNWASNTSTYGLYLDNMNTGNGIFIKNDSTGVPLSIVNSSSASIFKVDSSGNVDIPTGANFRIGGVNVGGGSGGSITWPLSLTVTDSNTATAFEFDSVNVMGSNSSNQNASLFKVKNGGTDWINTQPFYGTWIKNKLRLGLPFQSGGMPGDYWATQASGFLEIYGNQSAMAGSTHALALYGNVTNHGMFTKIDTSSGYASMDYRSYNTSSTSLASTALKWVINQMTFTGINPSEGQLQPTINIVNDVKYNTTRIFTNPFIKGTDDGTTMRFEIRGDGSFISAPLAGTGDRSLVADASGMIKVGSGGGGGSMVYPNSGIANSTGTGWGTSYAVGSSANDIPQLDANGNLNQDTTGTAAGLTSEYIDWNASSGGQFIQNKPIIYNTDYVYSDAITLTWATPTVDWDYSLSAHAIVNPYTIPQNKTLNITNVTEGAEGVLIYNNFSDIFIFPTNSVFTNGNNLIFGGNTMAICRFKYYTDYSGTKFHWTIERPINFNDLDVGGSANSMVPIWNSNGYVGLGINPLPNQYQLYIGSSMPSTLAWDVTRYSSAYLPIIYAPTTHTLVLDNLFPGATGTLLIKQPASGYTLSFNWPSNSKFQNGVQSINLANNSVTIAAFYSDGVNIYWNISGSYS